MVRVGLQRRPAAMESHSVSVRRRSGDTFSVVPNLGLVLPGEPIRYFVSGAIWGATVRFVVTGFSFGQTILDEEVPINVQLEAWLDTVAPAAEGPYTFAAFARSFPFLPFSHSESTQFVVSVNAPPPPPAPPGSGGGGFLGNIKGIVIAAAILAGIIVVAPVIRRIGRE